MAEGEVALICFGKVGEKTLCLMETRLYYTGIDQMIYPYPLKVAIPYKVNDLFLVSAGGYSSDRHTKKSLESSLLAIVLVDLLYRVCPCSYAVALYFCIEQFWVMVHVLGVCFLREQGGGERWGN